jgi:hypothetical protein
MKKAWFGFLKVCVAKLKDQIKPTASPELQEKKNE